MHQPSPARKKQIAAIRNPRTRLGLLAIVVTPCRAEHVIRARSRSNTELRALALLRDLARPPANNRPDRQAAVKAPGGTPSRCFLPCDFVRLDTDRASTVLSYRPVYCTSIHSCKGTAATSGHERPQPDRSTRRGGSPGRQVASGHVASRPIPLRHRPAPAPRASHRPADPTCHLACHVAWQSPGGCAVRSSQPDTGVAPLCPARPRPPLAGPPPRPS